MEEPHFVSCESINPSKGEESPKFEFVATNVMEVKVEPDDFPQELSVKEECESQDDNEEDYIDHMNSGCDENGIQHASPAVIDDMSVSTSCPQKLEYTEQNSHFFPPLHTDFTERSSEDAEVLQGQKVRLYVCKLCGEEFAKPYAFKKHKLKHTPQSFDCSVCGKSYSRKCDLQNHTLSHTGEKRFECALCIKAYARKEMLQNHLLTHSGEKPHVCTRCKKAFTQLGHLHTHMLIHTGHRPHTCATCDKGFSRKSNLKMHILTHIKRKTFCCTLCGRGFSARFNLRRHMSMHPESL